MVPDAAPQAKPLLSGLQRLLLVAIGLPVAITAVDQFAIEFSKSAFWIRPLLPALFVGQVGLLAACAGRFIDHVAMRCLVLAWSITLVDAVAITTMFFGGGSLAQCMMFSLISAQFGILIIWGIMSRVAWPVRLPLLLGAFLIATMTMLQSSWWVPWLRECRIWAGILGMQSVVVVALCSFMRFRGYRLTLVAMAAAASTEREPLQFAIKHVILWTTIVAPVAALAETTDWLWLDLKEIYWASTLAVGMALVSWLAMFAALGSRRLQIRLASLCVVPPLIGFAIMAITWNWSVAWGVTSSSWMFLEFRQLGFGWVSWTVLAAWFLAALLQVFRAAGYQIVRSSTSPAA